MEMLVKFIAVDDEKQIDDKAAYINDIYKAINSGGLIRSVNIDPDAVDFGVGAIRELDDDGNVFLLEFNSEEGKSRIFGVYTSYTVHTIIQNNWKFQFTLIHILPK